MYKSRKDSRQGPFRPINTLSSQQSSSSSSQNSDTVPVYRGHSSQNGPVDSSGLPVYQDLEVFDALNTNLPKERPVRYSYGSPGSSLKLGDSSSLFEESEYNPRLSPATPPSQRKARLREALKRPTTSLDLDNLYWGGKIPKAAAFQLGNKGGTEEIMVNEREPPRPLDHHQRPPAPRQVHDLTNTPNAPKFGEASPLRNPLMRDQQSNVFINRKPGHRPEFHKSNSQGFQAGPVGISKPSGPKMHTIPPTPRQVFSSVRPVQGFVPINTYDKPKPLDLSGGKKPTIDLTGSDDEFDADAAIRNDRGFGAVDPFAYVESNQANDNIKALLEGAFEEDDDDKPKTRLRRRKKKEQKKAEDNKVMSLADKLKALDMKLEAKKSPEPEPEEEEEEEDDGTVDGLDVKLLPHQVDGVAWMTDKESGQRKKNGVLPKGGILADDMGLGKTVQSIALILSNPRPDPEEIAADSKAKKDPNKIPSTVGKSTLVVAPLALIKQWEAEIKSKVLPSHALRVKVHHGQSRTKSAEELKKYDVVITTYQVVASEHASSSEDGPKVGCFGVHWYRIMLDEAHTIKNRNAKMTKAAYALRSHYRWCLTGTPMQNNLDELQSLIKFLRIKPYDELSKWKNDIAGPMKNGRGNLAMRRLQVFLKAFMKRRTKDVLKKEGALNPGGKASKDGKGTEGFKIVGRKIETIVADFSPEERRFYDRLADRAQSRLKEMMGGEKADYIGALVLLLRLRQACNHPQLVGGQVGQDKDAIAGAGSGGAPAGSQTPRKSKSEENKELDDLADLFGNVTVGTKQCDVCQIQLSKAEASAGAARCADCEADLAAQKQKHKKKRKSKGKEEKSKVQELDEDEEDESPRKPARMMRKKPVVLDSEDEEEGDWVVPENERSAADLGRAGGTDDENADGPGEWLDSDESESGDEPGTPTPKKVINLVSSEAEQDSESEEEEESDYDSDRSEDFRMVPSTKISRLLDILDKETPDHKVIVFSQFTSMLDLLEPFLRNAGFDFTRYDGSMRNDYREASLEKLRNDPSCRILLCSLKCGSLGLNLTAASRVVILEPFWNPFVEEQAIDRVHRINQKVDVVVYKLTISRSVEERILDLQEAKRKLATAAIEGGKAINKLSMKDIMNLFRRDAEHDHPVDVDQNNFASGFKGMLGATAGDFTDNSSMNQFFKKGRGQKERVESSRQEHVVYGRR